MAENETKFLLWAEKYRPRSLDDIVNQEETVARLKKFLKDKNAPHMLFAGPPGTGKTTTALAFAHDLYGESYHQYILELNASVTGDTPITLWIDNEKVDTTFEELERRIAVPDSHNPSVKVLSLARNGRPGLFAVTRLLKHRAPGYIEAYLEDGSTLKLTGNHSIVIWTDKGEKIIRASQLRKNMKLITARGRGEPRDRDVGLIGIRRLEVIDDEASVYDISVPYNQMFFAGETPVLLHNSDERGIDVIRTKIKEFARARVAGNIPFKLVILDESDNMCLDPETRVLVGDPEKNDLYVRSLRELLDEQDEEAFKIPTFNTDKLVIESDTGRIVRSGKALLYEIALQDGRKIKASPEHPFFVITRRGTRVVKTKDLRPGSIIADLKNHLQNMYQGSTDNLLKNAIREWGGKLRISHNLPVPHVEVLDIKPIGVREVLNITVTRNRNFILENGVLTHNTSDAQQALRRLMENFTATSRFILIANYPSKIIEPIQSRTALFRFTPLKKEQVVSRLAYIARREGVEYDEKALEVIFDISEGDMRKAINILQAASAIGKVTIDTVYKVVGLAHPREIREMINNALKGDFEASRKKLRELMVNYGLSGADIIKQVHREIFGNELDISEDLRVLIADYAGEIQFRLVEGADDEIQLNAFLAWLTLLAKRIGL